MDTYRKKEHFSKNKINIKVQQIISKIIFINLITLILNNYKANFIRKLIIIIITIKIIEINQNNNSKIKITIKINNKNNN